MAVRVMGVFRKAAPVVALAFAFGAAQAGTTTYVYDAHGRLESTVQPGGSKTKYYYDKLGNRQQYWAGTGTPPTDVIPVAVDNVLWWRGVTTQCVNVLPNDYSPQGRSLSVSAVGAAGHGTSSNAGSGSVCFNSGTFSATYFNYTLSDGYNTDTGRVDVYLDITNAEDDYMNGSWSGDPWSGSYYGCVDVLANDSDAAGDPLYITYVSAGGYGTAWDDGDGYICYTSNSFTNMYIDYTVSDLYVSDNAQIYVQIHE